MAPSPSPLALLSRGQASRGRERGPWPGGADLGSEKPRLCLRQSAAALPAALNTACLAHSQGPQSEVARATSAAATHRLFPRSRCACTLGQALARAGLQFSPKARLPTCEPERERRQEQPREIRKALPLHRLGTLVAGGLDRLNHLDPDVVSPLRADRVRVVANSSPRHAPIAPPRQA